jgi:hypothetical protein
VEIYYSSKSKERKIWQKESKTIKREKRRNRREKKREKTEKINTKEGMEKKFSRLTPKDKTPVLNP